MAGIPVEMGRRTRGAEANLNLHPRRAKNTQRLNMLTAPSLPVFDLTGSPSSANWARALLH